MFILINKPRSVIPDYWSRFVDENFMERWDVGYAHQRPLPLCSNLNGFQFDIYRVGILENTPSMLNAQITVSIL